MFLPRPRSLEAGRVFMCGFLFLLDDCNPYIRQSIVVLLEFTSFWLMLLALCPFAGL